MRLGTGEVQCSLRELAERARRIGLSHDLLGFTLPNAVRSCIFHRRGLESAERCGWTIILTGHHILIVSRRDYARSRGATSQKPDQPKFFEFHLTHHFRLKKIRDGL